MTSLNLIFDFFAKIIFLNIKYNKNIIEKITNIPNILA